MHLAIDFFHTLGSEVAFCYHLHFNLCTLYGISLANHFAECAVSTKLAIARDKQITQVDAVVNATLGRINGRQEAVHLLNGIRKQHGLEIVAIFQAIANACRNGLDILQHRCIFDAHNVSRGLCLDVFACNNVGKCLSLFRISAGNGQIGEAFEHDFLGM